MITQVPPLGELEETGPLLGWPLTDGFVMYPG